jgi:C-terminal processing protease CtpA/Prc
LFTILSEMIEPLHDAHTSLRAPSLMRTFRGGRPDPAAVSQGEAARAFEIVDTKYVQGRLTPFCNGRVLYGRVGSGQAGYLRILGFGGYAAGGYEADARELGRALDAMVEDLRGLKTLIIDVRQNGGGADPLGVMIASRLTDRRYLAFVKRARNDAADPTRFTAPQATWVEPAAGARFTGRVIELIGPRSVSAAETFSMALMGRAPRVVRIGEPTQGVFSDVLGRRLPNGWRFGLPNEVFLTEGGRHFEVVGVPPDIAAPVFTREDIRAGRDSALDKALELVSRGEKAR